MNKKLLIVGVSAYDAIQSPFGKVDRILGGSGVYSALAASYLQKNTALVSIVGEDFESTDLDLLQKHSVDVDGVEQVAGAKTFFWSGEYHNDLNTRTTLETQLNVLTQFQPKVPESYRDSDVVFLANLHPDLQCQTLDQLTKRPELIIMDTMNYWIENNWEELLVALKRIDVLSINDEEARQITGEYSLVEAARKIQEMGPRYVIIKKGEHGALLFEGEQVFAAPALPLKEVLDPTGAGDSFAGGFAGYLASQKEYGFDQLKSAVIFGSALASFTVEAFGTERLLSIQPQEFSQRLQTFRQLTQFEITLQPDVKGTES
ncbi:MAG: PfkB family carbohydrate kinase [Flavobacteriaceae bacterium]